MQLPIYPFQQLRDLLSDCTQSEEYPLIDLTIGEPQFGTPDFIQDALKSSTQELKKYPAIKGIDPLNEAIQAFINRRFNTALKREQFCSTLGSKEVLFNFPIYYLHDKEKPKMAFPNPFYPVYESSAIATKSAIHYLNLTPQNRFKPIISSDLQSVDLVILNSPNNPVGDVLSKKELQAWIEASFKYDFFLLNDECYSEIYRQEPPASLLEASVDMGNDDLKNIAVVNSLSKRSSSPGIRSGFIAGDEEVLKGYKTFRSYTGCAQPNPLQIASAKAWSDEEHTEVFRKKYNENFAYVKDLLDIKIPEAGFCLWLEVPQKRYHNDDLLFTKSLYEEFGIKVLPGSFMGRNEVGKGFVRIALVQESKLIKEGMARLQKAMR